MYLFTLITTYNFMISKRTKIISLISVSFIFVGLLAFASPIFAVDSNPASGQGVPNTTATPKLTNPLEKLITKPGDIPTAIGTLINGLFGIVGALALVMFIYGGLMMMLSGGNQEKVKKGQNILVWATVGIVVIFSSYIILSFIMTAVGGTASE